MYADVTTGIQPKLMRAARILTMPRRLRALLMLLAMLWQCLAMAGPLAPLQAGQGLEHTLLHSQATDHHHHDDASIHLQEADGTLPHQHAEGSFNTLGCLPSAWFSGGTFRPVAPVERAKPLAPSVDLEGLLRPPQRRA